MTVAKNFPQTFCDAIREGVFPVNTKQIAFTLTFLSCITNCIFPNETKQFLSVRIDGNQQCEGHKAVFSVPFANHLNFKMSTQEGESG